MRRILPAFACIALACAAPALAAGPGGHAGGASAGAGVNTAINAGGRGPSATAMENSNGRFAADREFGRDRAEERMSEQGRTHWRGNTTPAKTRRGSAKAEAGATASGGAAAEAGTRSR